MNLRKRILLLAGLLFLVSVSGIGNVVRQLPYFEHDPKAVMQCLALLGLFGAGLVFSVLELVRHEIIAPILQLAGQIARLRKQKNGNYRFTLTGCKDLDLLTRALNDLMGDFQRHEYIYRIFTEDSPDMIYLMDREGRVIFGNGNAARQWNLRPDEIIGKRQEELFPPEIAGRHKDAILKIFATGQPVVAEFHEMIGARRCCVDARLVPILDEAGRVTAVFGVSRDITEVEKTAEQYRCLFENAGEGILVADMETKRFKQANAAICGMLGYDGPELLALSVRAIHPEKDLDWIVRDFQDREKALMPNVPCLRKDGTVIYADIRKTRVAIDAVEYNMGFFADVTDRKIMADRLSATNSCLLGLGADFETNVKNITALCGELLGGDCALYNRLDGGVLHTVGQWNMPAGFDLGGNPRGHICYDVITGDAPDGMLFVPDLINTRYAETDVNIRKHGIRTYLGHAVRCNDRNIGSLCVGFRRSFSPTENDRKLFGILASALAVEEARRLTAEELRQSRQRFKELVETLHDWVWEVDETGRYTYVSPRVRDILGYEVGEVLGKTPFDLMPPDEALRVSGIFGSFAAERKQFVALENANICKDGRRVVMETSGLPFSGADGAFKGYRGVDRDITERKRMEENLRQSELKFRAIFDNTFQFTGLLTVDGAVVEVNKTALESCGSKASEVLGKPFWETPWWSHSKTLQEKLRTAIKKGAQGEFSRFETTNLAADGSLRHVDFSLKPIFNPDRKIVFLIPEGRDVTERVKAEKKAAMLSRAIETAHHGCLIISADYRIIFANDYGMDKLGFDFDALKELDLFSLCSDPAQLKDIIETGRIAKRWMGEVTVTRRDGGQFPALLSVTRFDADAEATDGGGDIILFQDISAQKELQDKILNSERLAVMGRLVADVAHEINNPLAIIIGTSQLALSRLDARQQTLFKNQIETVLRNARRCKTILNSLLGYGRTVGRKEETVNLPELIQEAIHDVNYQYDMGNIAIVLDDKVDNLEVAGNRVALLSVFVNLIRNARQAMGSTGCLTIATRKQDDGSIRIDIRDNGIGMDGEQLANLFKPFLSGWKNEEGSGLGLATSLGIVETHGGRMSANSAGEGKGTVFTIILPSPAILKKKESSDE